MDPLISVIVPVYNVEKYLDRCVESIVNQTYTNLEIILVDDGSPDNCPQMCDDWAKKDNRIKVIHKENGGVSSARNVGVDNSNGDYIAFVDSDDYIDKCFYEELYNVIKNYENSIVECSIRRVTDKGYSEHWGSKEKQLTVFPASDIQKILLSKIDLVEMHVCNKLFPRRMLVDIRFNSEFKYNEDLLFVFKAVSVSDVLVFIDNPLYNFYYNISSASHNKDRTHVFDVISVTDELYELCSEELKEYCLLGDVMKCFAVMQELIIDGSITNSEYKFLRKRLKSDVKRINSINVLSKYTRTKLILITLFPNVFKITMRIYGKKQKKKIESKYI